LKRPRRFAITRLETIIAIVLCSFAAGMGIMWIAKRREEANRAHCVNNLRQIGEAIRAYHTMSSADENGRTLPPSYLAADYATWAVLLAPHLADKNPLQQWDRERSYFVQAQEVREARLALYFCPARRRDDTLSESGDVDAANTHFPGGLGDYASVAGDSAVDWSGPQATGALIVADVLERKDDRILKWQSRTSLNSLKRGESYTILIGEKHVPIDHLGEAAFGDGSLYNGTNPASFSRIAGPAFPVAVTIDAPFNKNFGSYHGVIHDYKGLLIAPHFLMADASVRPLLESKLGALARRGD
jgi:hypothetical protein